MTRSLDAAILPTPVGPLAVVADDGVVVVSGFSSLADTHARLAPELAALPWRERDDLGDISAAVAAYAGGDLDALELVPVRQDGGALLQRMWLELRGVGAGKTASYSELAARADHPSAVRLAGNACARNMVAPFVPCHRIVKADGSLGNYYYGVDVKRALLEYEGALVVGLFDQ